MLSHTSRSITGVDRDLSGISMASSVNFDFFEMSAGQVCGEHGFVSMALTVHSWLGRSDSMTRCKREHKCTSGVSMRVSESASKSTSILGAGMRTKL